MIRTSIVAQQLELLEDVRSRRCEIIVSITRILLHRTSLLKCAIIIKILWVTILSCLGFLGSWDHLKDCFNAVQNI